jgi:hypothetical protein
MPTYTLISSNVLTSSAASVTFSAIPSTYTDLVLRLSTRDTLSGFGQSNTFRVIINGDTSGIYSFTNLLGDGSAASSTSTSGIGRFNISSTDTADATSNTFASHELYFPNYTVSQNKPISSFGAQEMNSATARIAAQALLWSSTAVINEIELQGNTVNWAAGSSFYLYGISSN